MDKLSNLEKGRQKKFTGDLEKIPTTISLSKSSREFLIKRGNKMGETIEALIWLASNGKAGYLSSKYELWRNNPPGRI
jgi:hypothetical protein